jgi:hypothetical protein
MVWENRENMRTPGPLGGYPGHVGGRITGPLNDQKTKPAPSVTSTRAAVPTFREVTPYFGMDEHLPSSEPGIIVAGIIVAKEGSNAFIFANGPRVRVASAAVTLDEITDPLAHPNLAKFLSLVLPIDKRKAGTIRIFNIPGDSNSLCKDKEVRGGGRTLKVTVLKQKLVTISIRAVQVRDDDGNKVSLSAPFDPQTLLNEMNSIWTPQANIVFRLGTADPALIDGAKPESRIDIANPTMFKSFTANKDPAAALTMFLLLRAYHNGTPVGGVTDTKEGFSLIADDRSNRTMAHEAGHRLGSLNERGDFSRAYGHQGTDQDLLMAEGAPGRKIPYGLVTDFNMNYR